MRISELIKKGDYGRFFLNEFTAQFGSIQFIDSRGGSISNCYFYRFNKTINIKRDTDGNTISKEGSFIDFYINKDTHKLQHIDFPVIRHFEVQIDSELKIIVETKEFYTPIIDISTWVSRFGRLQAFSYDDTKYLNFQDDVEVKIIHNQKDIIQFLFGEIEHTYAMNDNISFSIDSRNNLSALTITDEGEVIKLTSVF